MRTLINSLISLLLFAAPCSAQRFFGSDGPANLNPGWTFLQDRSNFGCGVPATGCDLASYPTTAGSVTIIFASFGNTSAEHISSITVTSGTWLTCPASNCNAFSATNGGVDAVFNFTENAGSTTRHVNLSANATTFYYLEFIELLPPPGYTPSLDVSGTSMNSSCSTTCNGVPLTLTSTDAVIQITNAPDLIALAGPFTWSSPYVTNGNGSGTLLNAKSVSGTPTFGLDPLSHGGSSWIGVVALAFKCTAGSFLTPTPFFTWVNYASSYPITSGVITGCNPSCNFTIPSTLASSLLFLHFIQANGRTLQTVTDNKSNTWVVPTGTNTCAISNGNDSIGCAYVLASASGTTTLTITISPGANVSIGVEVFEISRPSGSFVLDAQGSESLAATAAYSGQSLAPGCTGCSNSITGTNDVIFYEIVQSGGPAGLSLAVAPFNQKGNNIQGGGYTFFINYADGGILLNTKNGAAPQSAGPSNPVVASTVAFK